MNINLRINQLNLQPGVEVDTQDLEKSEFRSPGLMRRLVKRLPQGQTVYEAKNCTLDCFDDQLALFPCTHEYLNKNRRWHTRASVFLVNGKLQKVEFQVVDGVYAAHNFLEKFKSICDEHFGEAQHKQKNFFRWTNDCLSFSGFLHPDKVTADFWFECLDQ